MASLLANTHVGVANHPDEIRDVLPLPVPKSDQHEDLILRAMRGGATLSDIRNDFPRTLPLAGRAAWIFLLIVVLNTLHLGWSPASRLETELDGQVSAAQQSSLDYLARQTDYFLRAPGMLHSVDWDMLLATRSVDYNQELVLKGRPVSWEQIQPGLPPPGVAGSVRASALAAPPLRRFLEDPALSVKPVTEWPERLQRTRVLYTAWCSFCEQIS